MIRSESIGKIAKALVEAQKKMGAATKDSKNPFFKSNYADLSAVIDAAVPVLNDAGIAVLQNPTMLMTPTGAKSVMETVLLHESGEFMGSQLEIVTAKENDPQAYGSALSYARRYGLQSTVTLKAEDDDGEKSMGRAAPAVATSKYPKPNTVQAKVVEQYGEKIEAAAKASGDTATLGSASSAATNESPKKKVSFSKKAFETATSSSTSDDL